MLARNNVEPPRASRPPCERWRTSRAHRLTAIGRAPKNVQGRMVIAANPVYEGSK